MVKSKKWMKGIVLLCSCALLMSGCGASSKVDSAPMTTESATQNGAYASDDIYESASYDEGMTDTAEGESTSSANEGVNENKESVEANRKLIRNMSLEVETKEFDALTAQIEKKVSSLGGYMESTNIYNNSYGYKNLRNARFTARVPADKLDQFVEAVSGAANVTQKSETTRDVTLDYVDIQSRNDSLKVEQKRLMELMGQAEDVDTIIALESRLTEIRYQLESYESQLRTYDNLVDYATCSISISEVAVYTDPVVEEKNAFEKMGEGFVRSLKQVGNGFLDFIIWIVVNLPHLIVWAVIIFVIVLIIKKIRKRRKNKKEKKLAKAQENKQKAEQDRAQAQEAMLKAEEARTKAQEERM